MTDEEKKPTVAEVKASMRPPRDDDPSEGVVTHEETPFVEVRVNTTWAASYVNGEIASAIRLFHRPEFITDLMINSTHEAVKEFGSKWQGTEATDARKGVSEAVERAKARKAKKDTPKGTKASSNPKKKGGKK